MLQHIISRVPLPARLPCVQRSQSNKKKMSARAMKKLQGDALLLPSNDTEPNKQQSLEDDSEDEEESDDEDLIQPKTPAFAFLPDDDSSSSEEEEEEGEDEEENEHDDDEQLNVGNATGSDSSNNNKNETEDTTQQQETEQEFDALMNEFKERDQQDEQLQPRDDPDSFETGHKNSFPIITQAMDLRELDIDWTMRNTLSSSGGSASMRPQQPNTSSNNRTFLFGSSLNTAHPGSRQHRPANFVGGGIGMTTYNDNNHNSDSDSTRATIPWPYNTMTSSSDWYSFIHADGYGRDLQDFRYIQQLGDLSALLLFVCHHPFVTDALLQVSSALYQTNQSQNGLGLLKRCLWVYECTALIRFQRASVRFMDIFVPENKSYFEALRRLIHVSSVAGIWRTATAVSRYTLSLDPLRDPLNLLAVMDSYSLLCHSESVDHWIIDLVESNTVQIMLKETGDDSTNASGRFGGCELSHMPNWAYSYALALYRIHGRDEAARCDVALQHAIQAFPSAVRLMLEGASVDTTGRSFRRDWITVLDKITARHSYQRNLYLGGAMETATLQAVDNLIETYAKLSAKAWGDDDVLQFLYDNVKTVVEDKADDIEVPFLHPALMRYTHLRSQDWATRIQHLPEDANILDPGLVAQAMVIEPNRPRMLRRMPAGDFRGPDQQGNQFLMGNNGARAPPAFGGPPTGVVDPDLPLTEIFWRSFLPWNHVDGV